MTNYLENKLLDFIFRGQGLILPPALYLGLFTTFTDETGGGIEVTGGGYARASIPRSLEAWSGTQSPGTVTESVGASGRTSNNAVIQFPEPTGGWGVAVDFAVFDAQAGGNMLFYGRLAIPKSINNGDVPPSFMPSDLAYQIDN